MAAIGSRVTPDLSRTQKLRRLPSWEMCAARARDKPMSCHILLLRYLIKNVEIEVIKRLTNDTELDIDAAR